MHNDVAMNGKRSKQTKSAFVDVTANTEINPFYRDDMQRAFKGVFKIAHFICRCNICAHQRGINEIKSVSTYIFTMLFWKRYQGSIKDLFSVKENVISTHFVGRY
jgi:hypothetical protein